MSFDRRLTQLERDLGRPQCERPVTCVMVIEDPHQPLEPGELQAFLESLATSDTVCVVHLSDNGRGDRGPHVSFGGKGWNDPGFDIRDGRILGDWREGD
jgi:hypothetical protein